MITKTLKNGIFIIAIASFSFVGAQEKLDVQKDRSARMFKHLDINADEKITYEEYKKKRIKDPSKEDQVKNRFKTIDTDGSKTIDRAEFRAFFESDGKPQKTKNQTKSEKKRIN